MATRKEIRDYFAAQGYPDPYESSVDLFMFNGEWQDQYDECVQNEYNLCDFDRWQWLQRVLGVKIKYETAMKIDEALWEEDIETLELSCDAEVIWNT